MMEKVDSLHVNIASSEKCSNGYIYIHIYLIIYTIGSLYKYDIYVIFGDITL